jgi:hypothetical protein
MLSDTLDVITQVLEPQMLELGENLLALFREGRHEVAACETCTVTDWPGLILEAVEKSCEHFWYVWLEWLFIDLHSYFLAQLRDAVTGGLSDSMVVSLALHNVEFTDLLGILANYLLALVTVDFLPGVIRVDLYTFGHVVPIEAHSGDQESVILVSELFVVSRDCVVAPAGLTSSVSDLRPVVAQALGHDWHELVAILSELKDMTLGAEDIFRCEEYRVNHEVADFPHKSVDVVNALQNHGHHSIKREII